MKRHIDTRTERNLASGLKRWNKTAPDEVIAAEARYRLQRLVLGASKGGETQEAIAARLGYSVSQAKRIIRAAKRDRAAGRVSPLDAWRAHSEVMTDTPVPEPEAGIQPAATAEETQAAIARIQGALQDNPGNEVVVTRCGQVLDPIAIEKALEELVPPPRIWSLVLDNNKLILVDPDAPAPGALADAERALYATIAERAPLLRAAVKTVQLAAGIEATGNVDDATMSVIVGLAAWRDRSRPFVDDVEKYMAERRRAWAAGEP